jgi:hypothetical protein
MVSSKPGLAAGGRLSELRMPAALDASSRATLMRHWPFAVGIAILVRGDAALLQRDDRVVGVALVQAPRRSARCSPPSSAGSHRARARR